VGRLLFCQMATIVNQDSGQNYSPGRPRLQLMIVY
jgi:hypothetical protein